MLIYPVDQYNNLFRIEDVFPQHIVKQVLATDWLSLPWTRQEGQELWARRRIQDDVLPWRSQWEDHCRQIWPKIADALKVQLSGYQGTAWWLDEPGFTCSLHTDGEMPGSMQLTWIGALPELGTAFYHYKDPAALRHQFLVQPNAGYIMINYPDSQGFRHLQWHGMLTPVPADTFRLNSYSWLSKIPS